MTHALRNDSAILRDASRTTATTCDHAAPLTATTSCDHAMPLTATTSCVAERGQS